MPSCHSSYNLTTPNIFVTMSPLNTADLHRIFKSLDKNGDGRVSHDELSSLLEGIGVHVSHEELVLLVGEVGLDFDEFSYFYESISKDQTINVSSIASYYKNGNKVVKGEEEEKEGDLYKAFKVFDMDGDGLISSQELQRMLWRLGMCDGKNGLDYDRIIHKHDINSDGFLDFEEFMTMMLAY